MLDFWLIATRHETVLSRLEAHKMTFAILALDSPLRECLEENDWCEIAVGERHILLEWLPSE